MKLLLSLARVNGWMPCPKCHQLVEKTEACNHIKCKCGKDFCYACGGNYPKCNCIPEKFRNLPDASGVYH